MKKWPSGVHCDECARIMKALRTAWRDDTRALRVRLNEVAASSGRDVRQLGVGWVFSVATMPDDEMSALLESHYPQVARARRLGQAHEQASGHSVALHGWSHSLYGSSDPD